jgi:signal transduction histidine kinase
VRGSSAPATPNAERRKVEQNLHDGVQQRLIALRIELTLAAETAAIDSAMKDQLASIGSGIDEALEELREVAHGIYPAALTNLGLVGALQRIRIHSSATLTVDGRVGRHSPEVESAIYYSCLEAIQNATKHSGPAVIIKVTLRQDADELAFRVTDNSPGMCCSDPPSGSGLQNMRDRLGALDGHLSITTAPGKGTTVVGSIPLDAEEHRDSTARLKRPGS